MRILQIISKNDRYGAQRIFLDQISILHLMGNEITVVGRGNDGYVKDSVRTMGIPYHGISMKGLQDVLFLRRMVKQQKIDIIHTTLDRADSLGLLVSLFNGCPVISTMMVPRCHLGFRFMDRVIVLSRKQRSLLERRGVNSSRVEVIRPGIDVKRFNSPDRRKRERWKHRLGEDRYSIVFCQVSSMILRKAHRVSLELIAACKKRGEHPLLIIVGDPLQGIYYESLLRFINNAGLTGNVYFTGWTSDLAEILSLSHFTVLPSENEALGVALMEGMAAGTPIIAREYEGGGELIEDYGTGLFYKPAEGIESLAEEVLSLFHSRARYRDMSDKCRKTAIDEFSITGFGKRLTRLYERICAS